MLYLNTYIKMSNSIKKEKNDQLNTISMLPIQEIKKDTIILKDGSLRAIIKVHWLNVDLKTNEEILIIIEKYKKVLLWLTYPIQIIVRNNFLDITDYINNMRQKINKIQNETLKEYWKQYIDLLEKINFNRWLIYTKEFYIIIPYNSMWSEKNVKKMWFEKLLDTLSWKENPEDLVRKYRNFYKDKQQLDNLCNALIENLTSNWILAERLKTWEIISLLYKVYNPLSDNKQSSIDLINDNLKYE